MTTTNKINPLKKSIVAETTLSEIEKKMDKVSKDILEVRFITKENAKFTKTLGGFVNLSYKGTDYSRVNFYRTFPFSDPSRYISVREVDEKAREIGIIPSLQDLNIEERTLIEEQLNVRYFTPTIKKILHLKQEYGYAYFEALTDYGHCKFTTRTNTSSVVSLSDTRILLIDLDGNRFEIPNVDLLSAKEVKKLELLI